MYTIVAQTTSGPVILYQTDSLSEALAYVNQARRVTSNPVSIHIQ